MEDDRLKELAEVIDTALMMLKKVGENINDHRETSSSVQTKLLDLVKYANEQINEERQRRMLTERLLESLIAELVKSKTVDGKAVAERFLSKVEYLPTIFEPRSHVQAKELAEKISHPGFPDEMPKPRGPGPSLIVDNDQYDS